MKMENLEDLYLHHLQDIYNAEEQILKNLPKMAEAASLPELKRAFNEHTEETKRQIERLERVFDDLGEKAKGKKCVGMEGLIKEGEEIIKEKGIESSVRDAALIAAAQKVEHYEISSYGTARTFAHQIGQDKAAKILDEILQEESKTNEKLTRIAESKVNEQAAR